MPVEPGRDAYKLDEQDMATFLKWEFLSPLWDQGEIPTDAEWETHLLLMQISSILAHHPYCVPGNPSAELWNLYLDSGLNEFALKYYTRFNPSFILVTQEKLEEA